MPVQASLTELLLAGGALLLTLGVGTVAHEFAHVLILRALGVPFDLDWLPDRVDADPAAASFSGRWATVTPRAIPADLPPWGLRVAALAPLALATPMALVVAGVLPDPIGTGNLAIVAVSLAWFACALPSPQDFSLFWHAEAAIEEHSRGPS